jgi:hypothetical protein
MTPSNSEKAAGRQFFPWGILYCFLLSAFCGSGLLTGGELLGQPGGEAFGHAWSHWWRGEALPAWPVGTGLALGADSWIPIDPLPTLVSGGIGRLLGPGLGYNGWILFSVALAGAGGWALARRVGGCPWTGAVALAWAPPFLGSLGSGLTEDSALGLSAIGLAFLGEPLRKGGWLSGLCIGLAAFCGLLLGWLTGICAALLGITMLLQRRGCWKSIACSASIAASLAALAAWPHLGRLQGAGHRSGELQRVVEPLWRVNPWQSADLASLITPGRAELAEGMVRTHPGYLGLACLLLALAAPAKRWWVPLSAMAFLSLGPSIWWTGEPTGLPNPLYPLLSWLPGMELLNHHGRALLLGSLALAALASAGAAKMGWQGIAAAAIAVEFCLLSPISTQIPTTEPTPSPLLNALAEEISDGFVLPLPASGPGVAYQKALWEQRLHGSKIWMHPNRPGIPRSGGSPTLLWLAGIAYPDPRPPPDSPVFPVEISSILVRTPHVQAVSRTLGPPDESDDRFSLWRLPRPD